MKIMDWISNLQKRYVINQVKNIKIPNFDRTPIVRKRMVFSGKVQRVGFRLQVYELSKRLDLTGWVRNTTDGKVESELQGEKDKIIFLVEYMQSLKRITVTDVEKEELELLEDDVDFIVIK